MEKDKRGFTSRRALVIDTPMHLVSSLKKVEDWAKLLHCGLQPCYFFRTCRRHQRYDVIDVVGIDGNIVMALGTSARIDRGGDFRVQRFQRYALV